MDWAGEFRVDLGHRLEDLDTLADWVQEVVTGVPLADRDAFRFELAVTEAATNIISYAFKRGGSRASVCARCTRTLLRVELEDDGSPFDPLLVPAREIPDTLAEAEVGGLGIKLIRGYCDQLGYEYRAGRNVLTMDFYLRE